MRRILSIVDWVISIFVAGGEVAVALMCLHIVAEIIANVVFRTPIDGTPEIIARWYMVAIVFLPLALIQRRDEHIKAELFTSRLGPRITAALDAAINLAMAGLAFLFAWHALGDAMEATLGREQIELVASSIPVWPTRWFVPLGFGAMGFVAVLGCIASLSTAWSDRPNRDKFSAAP